jgi:hypothetical protein
MKVVLKPAGIAVILSLIAILGLVAFFATRSTPINSATGDAPSSPALAEATPATPPKETAFPEQVAAGWVVQEAGKVLEKSDTSNGECPLTSVALNPAEGEVRVKVSGLGLAPNALYPKYGLRILGTPAGDEMDIWIDPQAKVMTTHGRVGGTVYDWHTSPLPDGFEMTQEHTLSIRWEENGKRWHFKIDEDSHSEQNKMLKTPMQATTPLLMTYMCNARYRDLAIR